MKQTKTNSLQIVKKSYQKLNMINSKLKKFQVNLKIKGDKSSLDSVDIITFFSILDKEIEKNKYRNPDFMNENFFFKFNDISLLDIINMIKKANEK